MNEIKRVALKFKWYLLAAGTFLVFAFIRCLGASSKQGKYKEVVNDFLKRKREELQTRADQLSTQAVREEEGRISKKETEIKELETALEFRLRTGRLTPIDSSMTSKRLEKMGLK